MDFPKKNGYEDAYDIESMCLGKKSYIDILECVHGEGHKTHDQHAIMKGCPTSCIEYYTKETKMSVLDVYK